MQHYRLTKSQSLGWDTGIGMSGRSPGDANTQVSLRTSGVQDSVLDTVLTQVTLGISSLELQFMGSQSVRNK